MSALNRDPLTAGNAARVGAAPGARPWPADPGQRPRPAPTGAEWDPLCEAWPALFPARKEAPAQTAHANPPGTAARRHPAGVVTDQPPEPRAAATAPMPRARPGTRDVAAQLPRLALPPEPRPARDTAPSLLAYRLHRLWLTPAFRRFVCQGFPALLFIICLAAFWAGDGRRAAVIGFFTDLRTAIEDRPEFRVDSLEVMAETPAVAQAVGLRLRAALPESSLRLDLEAQRRSIEALDAVARASVQVRSGGVLEVRVTERVPAVIWRHAEGLLLLDAEGRQVALINSRALRPDLPLIAGEGAPDAVAEARALLAAAEPIEDRVLGLTRVSARRWDLVLDRDQRIRLPAENPVAALERVLAMDAAQDLLAREILTVDMRNPQRPSLRLHPDAAAELARIRQTDSRMAQR